MSTETDYSSQGPRWLLPAIIGGIMLLAAIATFVVTGGSLPQAAPPPPTSVPTVVVATAAPVAGAESTGSEAALPQTHGENPDGPPIAAIEVATAQERLSVGSAIFVDVRDSGAYAAGHIPGALTITSPDLNTQLATLQPGTLIIIYGDAARPDAGRRGAQIFIDLGFAEVAALNGGFEAWTTAGLPVEQ